MKTNVKPSNRGKKNAGSSDVEYTNKETIERVLEVFQEIDVDWFSDDKSLVPAAVKITEKEDAFKVGIPSYANMIFSNPIYSRNKEACKIWTEFFAKHPQKSGIMLNKFDPRTRWCQMLLKGCSAYGFYNGHYRFVGHRSGAMFAVGFYYFGPHPELFRQVFTRDGFARVTVERG